MTQSTVSVNIQDLLRNESLNQLSKIAVRYNASNVKISEKKTFPKQAVGNLALFRSFDYDSSGNLVGQNVTISTWLTSDEQTAIPTISDIVLSTTSVTTGTVPGTLVAKITSVGGVAPYTYTLTSNPSSRYAIVGDSLNMNSTADIATTPNNIQIQATDANGSVLQKNFSINVVQFANSKSVLFDGVDERIAFGDKFLFDYTNTVSYSLWFKPISVSTTQALYTKADSLVFYGWGIYINSTNKALLQMRTSTTQRQHIGSLSFNEAQWNHLVVTHDGTANINGARIYVNGVLDTVPSSGTLTGTMLAGNPAVLGMRGGVSTVFSGNMDGFSVWNKALTGAEVTELYNAGKPTDLRLHSAAANLKNWYRMGDGDTFPILLDNIDNAHGTMTNMEASDIVNDVP